MDQTGRPRDFTAEQVETALRKCGGNITRAAIMLDCSRCTVVNYMKRFPYLYEVIQESREILLDEAEDALRASVRDREWKAIEHVLKSIGRSRGWNIPTDVTAKIGGTLEAKHAVTVSFDNLSNDELDAYLQSAAMDTD